jgi:hypothetical protein
VPSSTWAPSRTATTAPVRVRPARLASNSRRVRPRAGGGGRVALWKMDPMARLLQGAGQLQIERELGVGEEGGGEVDVQPAVT